MVRCLMKVKNIKLNCIILVLSSTLSAQDLEPRRWTPLPTGTSIVGISYAYNSGDIGFDPLLEIEDTTVKRNLLIMSYSHFFTWAEKLMRFDAILPFHSVEWEGLLHGEDAKAERKGMGDPYFRLSVNLLGDPASKSEISKDTKDEGNTVVGAAIGVGVPLGEYFEDKLLNLSSNRYTIRPQVGAVHTRGLWSYELTGSIFFFTDNDDFFNGNTVEQDPFYALQAHIIRVFSPGIWGSLSAGYGQGGASKVNGIDKDDEREGFISALSFGFPIAENQGLKFSYVWAKTQTNTETRSLTNTFVAGWSMSF